MGTKENRKKKKEKKEGWRNDLTKKKKLTQKSALNWLAKRCTNNKFCAKKFLSCLPFLQADPGLRNPRKSHAWCPFTPSCGIMGRTRHRRAQNTPPRHIPRSIPSPPCTTRIPIPNATTQSHILWWECKGATLHYKRLPMTTPYWQHNAHLPMRATYSATTYRRQSQGTSRKPLPNSTSNILERSQNASP